MQGREVQYFDATDFRYSAAGCPLMEASGAVIAYFPPGRDGSRDDLSMWGPYANLTPGTWSAEFAGLKRQDRSQREVLVEVTANQGTVYIMPAQQLPEHGRFENVVEAETKEVEFRLRRL